MSGTSIPPTPGLRSHTNSFSSHQTRASNSSVTPQMIASQIPMLTSRIMLGFSPDSNRVHQTSYNPAKFHTMLPPTPPKFIRNLKPAIQINAHMNKNQSIQVTAVGYPEPVIAWYKDAVKLCDGVTITSSKIFALGSGSYTCVVKNQHGQDRQNI